MSVTVAVFHLAALILLPVVPTSGGEVVGTVRFLGTVPPARTIPVSDGSTITHQDLLVHPRTKGLRDVVVMLEDASPQPPVKGVAPAVMDQKDWMFTPRVLAVRHGQ